MTPFLMGGDMIEYVHEQTTTFAPLPNKFEAGTQNVEAVIGLGAAIDYIGSTDRQFPFVFYTSSYVWNYYHKYRKRGKHKPFVFIDTTPNENGMYDCFIFNAPMIKQVSVVAVFKDPRQLENYNCCSDLADHNFSFIDNEVKRRLIEKKVRYYRQLAAPILPNDQEYAAG